MIGHHSGCFSREGIEDVEEICHNKTYGVLISKSTTSEAVDSEQE